MSSNELWHFIFRSVSQNTKTTYDLSGDSTIIGVLCGKNRMVIFNGFNVTSSLPNSFELGEIFPPENTLPFPISIEGKGTGTLIVKYTNG